MEKSIVGLLLGFVCTALLANLANASCLQFNGTYRLGPSACYVIINGKRFPEKTYTGMRISADNGDHLSMFYELGSADHGFTTSYIANGKQHKGDINNTGKTYVASCTPTEIQSIRIGMFIAPFYMTFVHNPDGSYTLTETIKGAHPYKDSCSLLREP